MGRASIVAGFVAASLYCVLRSGAYSITSATDDSYSSSITSTTVDSYSPSGCFDAFISDGWCDAENNKPECAWDGGDVSLLEYTRLWLQVFQGFADGLGMMWYAIRAAEDMIHR